MKLLQNEQVKEQIEILKNNLPNPKLLKQILVSLVLALLIMWVWSLYQTRNEQRQRIQWLTQQNSELKVKAQLQLEIESLNVLINNNSKEIEWLNKEIQQAKELKVIKWNKFLEMNKLILE